MKRELVSCGSGVLQQRGASEQARKGAASEQAACGFIAEYHGGERVVRHMHGIARCKQTTHIVFRLPQ
jgi:hypothetical protein